MLLSFFFSKTIGEPWKLDITFLVLKYWHHNITSLLLLKTNHWKKLFDNQFLYFLSSNSSLNPWNMNSIPRFNLESNCYFFFVTTLNIHLLNRLMATFCIYKTFILFLGSFTSVNLFIHQTLNFWCFFLQDFRHSVLFKLQMVIGLITSHIWQYLWS